MQTHKIKAHGHHARQHGSTVRTKHEFFGEVCTALAGITEVLVIGSHTAQVDFQHHVEKHRAATAEQIDGYETDDQPSDKQLIAMARKHFVRFAHIAGVATPS